MNVILIMEDVNILVLIQLVVTTVNVILGIALTVTIIIVMVRSLASHCNHYTIVLRYQ